VPILLQVSIGTSTYQIYPISGSFLNLPGFYFNKLLMILNFSLLNAGLWIRIRIGSGFSDFVDPDPYWESGSRIRFQGQEN
jgi:hypothetical protein